MKRAVAVAALLFACSSAVGACGRYGPPRRMPVVASEADDAVEAPASDEARTDDAAKESH